MRRLMICTTAVLAFLAWSTLGKTSNSLPAAKPKVTIVFRGLLVFHPDPARQYFEAGILRAPEHNFRIEVRETSATGVSSFVVPTETQDGFGNTFSCRMETPGEDWDEHRKLT